MFCRELREELSLHAHDPSFNEITKSQWMLFMRSASFDARNAGWLVHLENDESITLSSTAWEYEVPDGFSYISKIYLQETVNDTDVYVFEIPRSHWEPRLNGSTPVISFVTRNLLETDKKIKIVGQGRPNLLVSENDTIDLGMESFIRERTLYFAFRYLGAGLSELARWRQQMSQQAWQSSELFLQQHPQEFRVEPDSRLVLGRN